MEATTAIIAPDSWTCVLPLDKLFDAAKPLEVDVGCGKGRFILSRAVSHPDASYLGIDRLLARLRIVDKRIQRRGLDNVRLLRIEASYAIEHLLPPASVTTFYVQFPDPWPKRRHHRRRLFSPPILDAIHRTLVTGGKIHLVTDHTQYFEVINEIFTSDPRFNQTETFEPDDEERTNFELIFLRRKKK
ncbi:tRNA (guanosine(46)-N7)-methyltransferase TrmB, partial [Verrucomicrobiota bacterium]